ncbi:hypothetical protein I7I50_05281 [Histoplasma capsulatum G186AR]|uniref:Uncharacterized protein n=1 Tax=Ajellomyces capsulatus TaxID=5037 RepID=A0A8H8D9X7_AJECA|nr:hypothetical protein I7I52_03540 [Histoplasma capsulatum]QSS75972.1 hypothetical protein I7I50_05281 [Histoplasma capsulatum G186AR]
MHGTVQCTCRERVRFCRVFEPARPCANAMLSHPSIPHSFTIHHSAKKKTSWEPRGSVRSVIRIVTRLIGWLIGRLFVSSNMRIVVDKILGIELRLTCPSMPRDGHGQRTRTDSLQSHFHLLGERFRSHFLFLA